MTETPRYYIGVFKHEGEPCWRILIDTMFDNAELVSKQIIENFEDVSGGMELTFVAEPITRSGLTAIKRRKKCNKCGVI